MQTRCVLALLCALSTGCRTGSSSTPRDAAHHGRWRYVPDLAVTAPPYSQVHAGFKERLDQPYAFVECRGSYADTGRALPEVYRQMRAAGVEPSGPPFGLFFDDPNGAPIGSLRSRACIPVSTIGDRAGGLSHDVLPSATVAYAVVSGPYPDVSQAYAGLSAYVGRMGWVRNGPVREVYLIAPDSVERYEDLLCEIQMPVANAP